MPMSAPAAAGPEDAATGSSAEVEKEHALELQRQYKAKKRKVIGCVLGVPPTLFVLGLLTGVIVIVEEKGVPENCAEISDRALCEASKAGCCYSGISKNCTELAMCDPVCGPGFESYANLGVEPCIACEPGWADTDENPTTPCAVCDPGTFAGTQSIECAPCRGGTADTDENAATMCALSCLSCSGCPSHYLHSHVWHYLLPC